MAEYDPNDYDLLIDGKVVEGGPLTFDLVACDTCGDPKGRSIHGGSCASCGPNEWLWCPRCEAVYEAVEGITVDDMTDSSVGLYGCAFLCPGCTDEDGEPECPDGLPLDVDWLCRRWPWAPVAQPPAIQDFKDLNRFQAGNGGSGEAAEHLHEAADGTALKCGGVLQIHRVPSERVENENWPAIQVWPWHHAPARFRLLSRHGGDEDWVCLLPQGIQRPLWADSLGVCDVSEHPLPDGSLVLIGAHA